MVDRLDRHDAAVARRRLLPWLLCSALALLATFTGCARSSSHRSPVVLLSGQNSTVAVLPAEHLDADGVDEADVVITAHDVNGHIVPGVSASIAASGSDNVVTQPFTVTNSLGQSSGRIAATSAGVRSLTITLDPGGQDVVLDDHPVVRFGPRAVATGPAHYRDANGDGACDAGDTLVVTFDRPVAVVSHDPASFALAVAGDSLGGGATVAAGPTSQQVTITLGAAPHLRARGVFDGSSLAANAPSGIDVSSSIATGAIVDVATGQTAEPNGSGSVDVDPALVAVTSGLEGVDAVAAAPIDVDRDGDPDAIVVDPLGGATLWQNDGAGRFTLAQGLGSGTCVAVGDVDRDGDDDVVLGVTGSPATVLRNDGGVLNDSGQSLGSSDATSCVALADVDRDHDLDVITGAADAPIRLYLNDGSGSFTESPQTLGAAGTMALAAFDVDRDGDQDLVSGGLYLDDQVWINDGSGTFSATGVSFHAANTTTYAVADLDHDGDLDLAAAAVGDLVTTWFNDGAGAFTWSLDALGAGDVAALTLRDFDGDGLEELATGGTAGILIFPGVSVGHLSGSGTSVAAAPAAGFAVADWNRDGDPDLLAADGSTMALHHDSLSGTFGATSFTDSGQALGSGGTSVVVAGDVDRDGHLDFVEALASGATVVWKNDGTGHFTQGATVVTGDVASLVLGDVDGDGDLDLVVGFSTLAGARVYLNDGSGSFTDSLQLLGGSTVFVVAAGDVDGDGDLDVVVGEANGFKRVWLNDGSGSFSDSGQALTANVTSALALGDVDGDGDLDLIEGVAGLGVVIWANDGTGTFSDTADLLTGDTRALALADLDRDGDLDLVLGNSAQDNVILLNDGFGAFSLGPSSPGSSQTRAIVAADLNHDGKVDFLDASLDHGLHAWINDGTATFTDAGSTGTTGFVTAAAGDVDLDGDLDVICGSSSAAPVQVLLHD
jgi:large repetitive protein